MRDDRDDVLHTAPAIKNIVTTVTVVTENSFQTSPIFSAVGRRIAEGVQTPLCRKDF